MPKKYRSKPVVIEAIQFTGHNANLIAEWADSTIICMDEYKSTILIKTLEGDMLASPNDFIIKGLRGEFYPCKPDVFAAKYEEV